MPRRFTLPRTLNALFTVLAAIRLKGRRFRNERLRLSLCTHAPCNLTQATMSDDETLYLHQARDAQNYAERARTEEDRRAWLRLAQAWLALIRPRPRTAQES